jgi:hypothetical protein
MYIYQETMFKYAADAAYLKELTAQYDKWAKECMVEPYPGQNKKKK